MALFEKILAATDFGRSSERAVALATDLAIAHDASVSLVHAYSVAVPIYPVAIPPPVDEVRDAASAAMERALHGLRGRVAKLDGFVRHGDAWTEIIAAADEIGADLIVMGTHGYRGVSRFFLGSVADKVVRSSPIPVLIVPEPHGKEHR